MSLSYYSDILDDNIDYVKGSLSGTIINGKKFKPKNKVHSNESQARIQLCLNCTKEKCNGNCEDVRRIPNE